MFKREKIASLFAGAPSGSASAMPEALASFAKAGLLRVVRANPNDFIVAGLLEAAPVWSEVSSRSGEQYRSAVRGHYKLHPLAVALAKLSISAADARVDRVVGHLVLGCLLSAKANHPDFLAARYAACLATRKFMDMACLDLLDALDPTDGQLNLDDHRMRLAQWKLRDTPEGTDSGKLRREVEDLERFHLFLVNQGHPQPGRERNRKAQVTTPTENHDHEHGPTPGSTSLEKPLALPPEPVAVRPTAPIPETLQSQIDSSHAKVFDVPCPIVSDERIDEAEKHGEPVAEGVDQFEVTGADASAFIGQPFALPRQRLPQGHFQLKARRAATQDLALANPATLRCTDIELLVASLSTGGYSTAIRAAVVAALYSGQPAEKLLEWDVLDRLDDMQLAASPRLLVLKPFGLQVPIEATKGLPRASEVALVSMAPAVFLPLNLEWRGVRVLHTHATRRVGQRLFTAEEIVAAAFTVKQLGTRQTTALTLPRISAYLPRRIRDSTEDLVLEALVTGGTLSLSASSRLHYVQTNVKKVADHYWQQATKLHHELGGNVVNHSLPELPFAGSIGSQRCPPETELPAWIASLCCRVGTPPRGRPTRVSVAEFHNLYSAFVVQNLAWASGVRPHRKAMAGLAPVGTTFFIDEKERGVAALRQVPICPQALTQWNFYKSHREWVIGFLELEECPLFFSINEKGRVVPLTFARVRKLTEHPFENNAHRHYFSTSLRSAGLSGGEVNVLMGHAVLGEETGNRFNALDPRELRIKAVNAIQAWMTRDGWMAREGFGRG